MKKVIGVCVLFLGIFLLVGCSNSDKATKEVQEVIDAIIGDSGNKEADYSFKVYHDEKSDNYIVDTFVPVKKKPSVTEFAYFYHDGKLTRSGVMSDLTTRLDEGSFKEVYVSGKFKK